MTDLITQNKLTDKRVLMRVDFNVPMENGKITDDTRIRASLPAIIEASKAKAKVMVMSHLGQPEEGKYDQAFSLEPIAEHLSKLLGQRVRFISNWIDGLEVSSGEIVLFENVRFNKGEKKDDEILAKKMAALCDVFVMDAFASAHRAQASTHGVAKFAPVACAGPLLETELDALSRALEKPEKPLLAIVGGSKVSTKIQLLENLLDKVDILLVGGGIANTFIAAAGLPIGKSLYEADFVSKAQQLIEIARQHGAEIPIPIDVVVAKALTATAVATVKDTKDVAADDLILDIGPKTCAKLAAIISQAKTVVWNGPIGVFEYDQFATGTKTIINAIASNQGKSFSIAGGGDTTAAIDKFGATKTISYISTGGGAFLEFLQGDTLPAIAILEARALLE